MSTAITVAVVWFVYSTSKIKGKNELQKKKMDLIDKHFDSMIRIECPYCKTIYKPDLLQCPNCKANTKEILFPEIPDASS
jgi:phage FluMu protein Com